MFLDPCTYLFLDLCTYLFLYLHISVSAKAAGGMAAVDMDEGAGEGWGDDADLVLDDGKLYSTVISCN